MSSIEFWRSGEWTMVYQDGQLKRAGDHYLASEWLEELAGVKVVDDPHGVCIPDGRNPLRTLAEVHEADTARVARMVQAEQKRAETQRLLEEAEALEAGK